MNSQNTTSEDTNSHKIGYVLKVTCKSVPALLYVKKYESGRKGKCILVKNAWMTPNEFEKMAGSKAKKHLVSIKFQGHSAVKGDCLLSECLNSILFIWFLTPRLIISISSTACLKNAS